MNSSSTESSTSGFESETISDRWLLTKCIGEGTYGSVYGAVDLSREDIGEATTAAVAADVDDWADGDESETPDVKPTAAVKVAEGKGFMGLEDPFKREKAILKELASAARLTRSEFITDSADYLPFPRVLDEGEFMPVDKPRHHFYVMSLGWRDLSYLKKRSGSFSPATVARIALDVLYTLELMHGAGLLHRDIKPANICAVWAGEQEPTMVMVIDFGGAHRFRKRCGELKRIRKNVFVPYTAYYASLEAHEGSDLLPIDDLWALLYSILDLLNAAGLPWADERPEFEQAAMKQLYRSNPAALIGQDNTELMEFHQYLVELDRFATPAYKELAGLLRRWLNRVTGEPTPRVSDAVTCVETAAADGLEGCPLDPVLGAPSPIASEASDTDIETSVAEVHSESASKEKPEVDVDGSIIVEQNDLPCILEALGTLGSMADSMAILMEAALARASASPDGYLLANTKVEAFDLGHDDGLEAVALELVPTEPPNPVDLEKLAATDGEDQLMKDDLDRVMELGSKGGRDAPTVLLDQTILAATESEERFDEVLAAASVNTVEVAEEVEADAEVNTVPSATPVDGLPEAVVTVANADELGGNRPPGPISHLASKSEGVPSHARTGRKPYWPRGALKGPSSETNPVEIEAPATDRTERSACFNLFPELKQSARRCGQKLKAWWEKVTHPLKAQESKSSRLTTAPPPCGQAPSPRSSPMAMTERRWSRI
ncbi:hypothetical protein HDU96_002514 [Phlyctochytrium bullatum]|nr:hypothetical protein HDU96_002514 [Phlyctochytrium bullatum]